ncbi:MAG: hypothetical protein MJ231_02080 [bacterium]|nr:hypothetical protein [bacterium]
MNPINPKHDLSSFITRMTKADAIEPIIALEAVVVTGRTIQAYKRGGKDEARERFIEEINGSIVWLAGVKVLNDIGDWIIKKILKQPSNFDVGTDKVLRRPFDNYMNKMKKNGISGTKVAELKGAKVLTSVLLANLFIGFVVPKINHALTNSIHRKNKQKEILDKQNINTNTDITDTVTEDSNKPAFKGAMSAMNKFTNIIENTNTGKLLSTDVGVAGGRMINARNADERREIGIRDIGSIYFYMWAQGHIQNLLNFVETGRFTRLNPTTANTLTSHLEEYLKANGGEVAVEQFKKDVLGKKISEITLPEGIQFEEGKLSGFTKFVNKMKKNKVEPLKVAKVEQLAKIKEFSQNTSLMNRIREMAKIQPELVGEAVITKQQIIDAINEAKINDPKFLDNVFNEFTKGASKDEFKYVSNSKLYKLKSQMEDYVLDLCKKAKDGKIDKKLLDSVKSRNVKMSGINFLAGFAFAALFLSTLIPKFQYYVTRKKTGRDEFPGTYDIDKNIELKA